MNTLGIDPGKRCGWAHVIDGEVMASGVIDGSKAANSEIFLASFAAEEIDLLVVEGRNVFFGAPASAKGKRQIGMKSIATMFFTTDIWRVLAELRGIRCEVVLPQTWQAHYHLTGKRDDRARATRTLASSIVGRKVVEDEAQAILIAFWASAKEGGK